MRFVKAQMENLLRNYPPLFRLGSKVYHKLDGAFKTLSPGTPQAILEAFELAKKNANGQPVGDYYEFGLFRGYTYLEAYRHCQSLGLNDVQFHGFDSFEGMPPPTDDPENLQDNQFFEGQFACSLENVTKNLQSNGMPADKINLVKGFYNVSLTEELRSQKDFKPAAVVLLDCDYYSSTKVAMQWMLPYLAHNTIMLFDDWFTYGESDELGQQRALGEFLQENPQFKVEPLMDFLNHGKGFILKNA